MIFTSLSMSFFSEVKTSICILLRLYGTKFHSWWCIKLFTFLIRSWPLRSMFLYRRINRTHILMTLLWKTYLALILSTDSGHRLDMSLSEVPLSNKHTRMSILTHTHRQKYSHVLHFGATTILKETTLLRERHTKPLVLRRLCGDNIRSR